MTWRNSSSSTARLRAARLSRPLGGKAPVRGAAAWVEHIRPITLPQGEVRMGEHHHGDVTVETMPGAALVVVQPELALGVLVEALDHPAQVHELDQFLQRDFVQAPGEVVFQFATVAGQGALADEPAHAFQVFAALARAMDPDAGELLDQGALGPLAPGDVLPRRRGQ